MTPSFSDRVTVAPDVLFRVLSDEAVLVNLKTERYLGLNPVGARMWAALTGAPSIQAAFDTLVGEYDVDPDELRRDLSEFIEQLLAQHLVEARPAAS
jgi:coenzyme PQQ synthesis protein D (PqqD)